VLDAVEVEPGSIRTACLIGSGGAALAAVAAFRLLRVGHLLLNVRDQAKGKALLAKSGMGGRIGAIDDRANLTGAQLIVNATTLGMDGQSPMPESVLTAISDVEDDRAIVLDMVYAPLDTELLQAARGRRLRAVDGLKMLVGQAASAFDTFFHVPPPRQFDGELRALLTS
jgi:shikimate dehydrogenase